MQCTAIPVQSSSPPERVVQLIDHKKHHVGRPCTVSRFANGPVAWSRCHARSINERSAANPAVDNAMNRQSFWPDPSSPPSVLAKTHWPEASANHLLIRYSNDFTPDLAAFVILCRSVSIVYRWPPYSPQILKTGNDEASIHLDSNWDIKSNNQLTMPHDSLG